VHNDNLAGSLLFVQELCTCEFHGSIGAIHLNHKSAGSHRGAHASRFVLIRLTRKLAEFIDGIDLSGRSVGDIVEMPERDAWTLIAENWAERVTSGERQPLVLIVEDDSRLREYYRAGLAARFVVDECADGMSALAYFDRRCPDAVILDLNLPRLHGQILYKELRHQPRTASIPIIVVTGIDPTPDVPGALVLRKPCEIDVIIGALQNVLTLGAA
jgi:CheY-like chemotaxis protein